MTALPYIAAYLLGAISFGVFVLVVLGLVIWGLREKEAMVIDIDAIEEILSDETERWHVSPTAVAELVAEVRIWRAAAVAHRAFIDTFNASPDREGPEVDEAYDRMDEAQTATRPYEQAAIDAARK